MKCSKCERGFVGLYTVCVFCLTTETIAAAPRWPEHTVVYQAPHRPGEALDLEALHALKRDVSLNSVTDETLLLPDFHRDR